MTREQFEEVMRIPSCSGHEDMMQDFLLDWAKRHGVKAKRDSKGNIFMEKGSSKLKPGLCNHMDTVHNDQIELIRKKTYKTIKWDDDKVTAVNPLTDKPTGLGMDDQGGCAIALAVIDRLPNVKAAFFVEEEVGMAGSRAANLTEWIKDVSFVFSNDSPDRNRGTKSSSGVILYSDEFFKNHLEDICKSHGLTDFRNEPYTDIKNIRLAELPDGKHIECLNFGNGGYNAHRDTEYAKFSEVNAAEELLYELCTKIPSDVQYSSDVKNHVFPSYSYSNSLYGYGSSHRGYGFSGYRQSIFDKTFMYKWKFVDSYISAEDKVEKFIDMMNINYRNLNISKINDKAVKVVGEYSDIKRSYVDAYNIDNNTNLLTWLQFIRAEPDGNARFNAAVEEVKAGSKTNIDDNTECSLMLDFDSAVFAKSQIDEFKAAVKAKKIDVEIDDSDKTRLFIVGKLKNIKLAFVEYANIMEAADVSTWEELAKSVRGLEDFWENLEPVEDTAADMTVNDDYIDIDSVVIDRTEDTGKQTESSASDDIENSITLMDWLKSRNIKKDDDDDDND